MKIKQKYLLLSVLTVLAVAGMSFSTPIFAQTVTSLTCSVGSSSVVVNQTAILTATGGNGTYFWSGQNLNVTNSAGSQFAVSYPNTGTFQVTVSSAGQSATCSVNVVASVSSGNLMCSPAIQNVTLGQTANVSASGGNGAYTWSSPELRIINPNGSGFSASFASAGAKTLTVTSAGLVSTCVVNVLGGIPTFPTTPGFPNTGGGYGK